MNSKKILIAITSCERDATNGFNQAIRDTWLARPIVDYRFFRGIGETPAAHDEVILECKDDYLSLPDKTLALLKWAMERDYDYVFKCDTDTYVNVNKLLASNFANYDYFGTFNQQLGVPNRVYSSLYAWASGGSGYCLSRKAALHIIENPSLEKAMCPNLKIPCEDLWVGQVLGPEIQKLKLKAHHEENINPGYRPDFLTEISSHYCSENQSRKFDISWMHSHHQKNKIKPMICCLQGGMGNQMFQYAMAKAQAIKHGAELQLNISRFKNDPMRQYSLGLWAGIDLPITSDEYNLVKEDGLPYNERVLSQVKPDSTLLGYWQTEKYFSEIKDLLKQEFVPRAALTEQGEASLTKIKEAGNRSVFLTVRRTDYVTSNFHGVLSIDYYLRALDLIAKIVPNPIVFVFSDEPEWCKENLNLPYETHVCGNYDMTTGDHLGREDEELWLMMHCRHAVMANSSYSWWGAWLGEKEDSIVIAPKQWFMSTLEDPRDIVPTKWIQL